MSPLPTLPHRSPLARPRPAAAGPEPGEFVALEPLGELLRVEHLPGVGHCPHEERPADVARLITTAAGPRYAAHR